jgi:hypothetical protein
MALHGNRSVLLKSPGRFLNGNTAAGGGFAGVRSNFNKHGMSRNAYENYSALSATPDGHLSGSAWILPKTGGGMSSHNITYASFGASGLAVGGITADAPASFAFTVADADGQLISSGTGTASLTFTVADLLLTASLNGTGSSSFTITSNTPQLGAEASGIGNAVLSFTASLTPYAIGNMVGNTEDTSTIVNANIVSVNGYSVTGNGQTGTEWGPA